MQGVVVGAALRIRQRQRLRMCGDSATGDGDECDRGQPPHRPILRADASISSQKEHAGPQR